MDDDAKIQLRLLWRICVRLKEHGQDSTLLWMDAVHAVYGGGAVLEYLSPTRCSVNGEVYDAETIDDKGGQTMMDDDDYGKRNPYHIPPGNWPEWWKAIQVILVLGVLVGVVAVIGWIAWG